MLFPTHIVDGGGRRDKVDSTIARDGRFLINMELTLDSGAAPITLLQNWQGGLSAREE